MEIKSKGSEARRDCSGDSVVTIAVGGQRGERLGGLSDSRAVTAYLELELALLKGCPRFG